jgi:predicted P-loop ATPase
MARIYNPGCQADYMLILEGGQGTKKSTACQIIGGAWFSDSMPENLAAKDASQHIRGKWLIELGELHALSRSEITALKAFLSRRIEIYRPSYGRREVHEPRQAVFVGTTNKTVYLRDETGGRRFWPVKVGNIDIALLASWRDQLFAEAVHLYREGWQWWPNPDFERTHIQPQQEERFEADVWEELIAEYLVNVPHTTSHPAGRKTTVLRIARDAIRIETPKIGTADQRRIIGVLEQLGWVRGKRGSKGERWWVPK